MMKLNCDLGEGFDDVDPLLMPHIDLANIACGGHAGDGNSMRVSIALANQHNVLIGAHPSYPDRENFGRKTLANIEPEELFDSLCDQVEELSKHAEDLGCMLNHIKPHGALYNDASANPDIFDLLINLAQQFDLPLVIQGLPSNSQHQEMADRAKVTLLFEAFADRAYSDQGTLVPRQQTNSVYTSQEEIVAQATLLKEKGGVNSVSGKWLNINAETICIHSDTIGAAKTLAAIRQRFDEKQ